MKKLKINKMIKVKMKQKNNKTIKIMMKQKI